MRVPLSWLRDYVDFDLPPERLAERLTLLGLEVQGIERIGSDWDSVVVGELLEVVPHPRADRLNLTTVRVTASDEPRQIVCGAHNIEAGQRVPVALPGAVLPGDRRIGMTTIQGTESQGMLCSGAELGLTTDAEGILILPPDTLLGAPLADVCGDVVLDVDVKPNRGDLLSMIGLAREVAAITGGQVRWPGIKVPESGDATNDHLWVEVADRHLCPRFVGRYVDNVKVGPSPFRVQLRLAAAGMRPVSNVVDASNYVMLEMGKPVHTFDAGAVSGGQIVVRPARNGETIETLDHVQRTLTPETLIIADARGPIGIAGVMGGAQSEVSGATTAVIVESAIFDAVSIRRTAFRYALRSEASLRFEKGQESRLARVGADRTAQLLAEWAGGRVATGVVDTNPVDDEPVRVSFRPAHVDRLLGLEANADQMTAALARVGIESEAGPGADELVAVVPPYRRDIVIEADVAEEIARVIGYDTVPSRLPDTEMPAYRAEPTQFLDTLRDMLCGRSLNEVVTNALIGPDDHAAVGIAADDPGTIRAENPISADHSQLRRTMLPGMLGVLVRNERQRREDVAIFEIGNLHEWHDDEPAQMTVLAILLAGNLRPASWAEPAHAATFEDVKGIVETLAARCNIDRVEYAPVTDVRQGVDHPGRTAGILAFAGDERRTIGRVFEVDPRLLRKYDVHADHVSFAILWDGILSPLADRRPQVKAAPSLPVVERDIAVLVARDTPAARVEAAIRGSAGPSLSALTLFDRYQGPPLDANQISIAYRLRFQPTDEAADAAVDAAVAAVTQAVEREVGGRIRSGA
ncbi:MAG TPA: phenylalanine--tRNA ligase subunit beta [Candidatus Limnocylindrales bacterium]